MPTPTHNIDTRETASATASSTERSRDEDDASDLKPPPPLVLRVALRPGRVTTLTLFSIGSIVAIVLFFHEGHEHQRFDKSSKTPQEQDRLLDLYNPYAGNVAAVFGKPLELFVTGAVQVLTRGS